MLIGLSGHDVLTGLRKLVAVSREAYAAAGHSSLLFYMIKCLYCTYLKICPNFFLYITKSGKSFLPYKISLLKHLSLRCSDCPKSEEAGSVGDVSSSGASYYI